MPIELKPILKRSSLIGTGGSTTVPS